MLRTIENNIAKHPGAKLLELMDNQGMTQKELSVRTGMTEKHISTVINGKKGISVAFAKKLEYAFGVVSAKQWLEWQAEYDTSIIEAEEKHNITQAEIDVLKPLNEIIEYIETRKLIDKSQNVVEKVLQLRRFMGVSNLTAIPDISINAAYRAQVKRNASINQYVLYAWQRLCECLTANITTETEINRELLKERIPEIKALMLSDINEISGSLTRIFSKCGIAFRIIRHFRGAPVQGFIRTIDGKKTILCLTLRQARADIFWFTLFHEIAHILNGDAGVRFVDFNSVKSEAEAKADEFAGRILLDPVEYRNFVIVGDYSKAAIERFAAQQQVRSFIVVGRMQRDELLEWDEFNEMIPRYKWAVG